MRATEMIVTTSEFADRRGVTPATVRSWILRRHLTAPALRPDGRINVELAERQLSVRLDPVRVAARSTAVRSAGIRDFPARQPGAAAAGQPRTPADAEPIDFTASRALLQARALSASVDAERKRRELNFERGKYMLADDAMTAWAGMLTGFLAEVEASIPDLVRDLNLDRTQAIALRKWWRERRERAAQQHAAAAAAQPDFVVDAG